MPSFSQYGFSQSFSVETLLPSGVALTEYGDLVINAYVDEWGRRKIDGLLEDAVKIIVAGAVPPIVKTWSALLNVSHVLERPLRLMRLVQALKAVHVFSRPFRFFKITQALNVSHVFFRHRLMKLIQTLQALHAWAVTYPGLILKQWFATLYTAHTFKRPFRLMRFTQTLQTLHTLGLKRFFRLLQSLNLSHVFKRPFRRIGYVQQLQTAHVFSRPVRLIKLPAALQLTHVFGRPYRLLRLVERLSLGHAYFVTFPGVKKTKLFLVIGDLAIQLSGD